jgi:hypothetical protein
MKNGAPFYVAFGMSREMADTFVFDRLERLAMTIVFGELEGAKFDWGNMAWKEPK